MNTLLTDDGNVGSSAPGSISQDLAALRSQRPHAGQVLDNRFRDAIVVRARSLLSGTRSRVADEEDIAQEALFACLRSVHAGKSAWVRDRHQFWRLLVASARRKAADLRKKLARKKRCDEALRGESAFIPLGGASDDGGITEVPARDLSPDRALMMTEEYRLFLASLKPEVRDVVLLKVDGYTNREIAERLEVAVVTVERRLQLIRKKWNQTDH
jgi:RNA polymerase sigma factor (sigma-70 family)